MAEIFGTLGPSCRDKTVLTEMFRAGMTGIRINLSHISLKECKDDIDNIHAAAKEAGVIPKILIDMQGPELRIGTLKEPLELKVGDILNLPEDIPVKDDILKSMDKGDELLFNDGKVQALVQDLYTSGENPKARIIIKRGGSLSSGKSISIVEKSVFGPAVSEADEKNLEAAGSMGITGVMQPFVRNKNDLISLKKAMRNHGCEDLRIYAKVEDLNGVKEFTGFIDHCDEVVIARGDLGNSMPLWQLPGVQKEISAICRDRNKPFMVVTEMLSSMEKSPVPTRAEVSDIYNAVLDRAHSVMVTGETAVGNYPVEVIKYLSRTAGEAETQIRNAKL